MVPLRADGRLLVFGDVARPVGHDKAHTAGVTADREDVHWVRAETTARVVAQPFGRRTPAEGAG